MSPIIIILVIQILGSKSGLVITPTDTPPDLLDPISIRSDYVSYVQSAVGSEGRWGENKFCEEGQFGKSIKYKAEPYQGIATDDVAGVGVRFVCQDPDDQATSHIYKYQDYSDYPVHIAPWYDTTPARCPDDTWISGIRTRVDSSSTDAAGLTCLNIRCSDGTILEPGGCQTWGSWGSWADCPSGTYGCGWNEKYESYQGFWSDDSALNAVNLACCTFPVAATPSPVEPSMCCTNIASQNKWKNTCPKQGTKKKCERFTDKNGNNRCGWIDCSLVGECNWIGGNRGSQKVCGKLTNEVDCEGNNNCDWTFTNTNMNADDIEGQEEFIVGYETYDGDKQSGNTLHGKHNVAFIVGLLVLFSLVGLVYFVWNYCGRNKGSVSVTEYEPLLDI